jgi:hypothetical protein
VLSTFPSRLDAVRDGSDAVGETQPGRDLPVDAGVGAKG